MSRSRELYMEDILQSIAAIEEYTANASFEDFECNGMLQDAVVRRLTVVGEASSRLMALFPGFTEKTPEIPWRKMAGTRNRIVHAYDAIDLDIVWDIVRVFLPDVRNRLQDLMHDNR